MALSDLRPDPASRARYVREMAAAQTDPELKRLLLQQAEQIEVRTEVSSVAKDQSS